MKKRKIIFISYKSEQREYAFVLRDKLHQWGYETWLDVDKLRPGMYWGNEIDKAIKTCDACVGIMTPAAIKSRMVTNEWDLAIVSGKSFIPLMFEKTEPHYKYIDIQYLDCASEHKEDVFSQLKQRLEFVSSSDRIVPQDPYHDYLQTLYNRINRYLFDKLGSFLQDRSDPEPIHLSSKRVGGAVASHFEQREEIDPLFVVGGISQEVRREFTEFSKAFDYFKGRVLLLGEPGAGKTITLLYHARDAIVKRWLDPSAPLPVLGIIPTWSGRNMTQIDEWLEVDYKAPDNLSELIRHGDCLLLLDGLDELGKEAIDRENNNYDPREYFLKQLPSNNQIILTCRVEDYFQIGKSAGLNGAIQLQALNKEQMRRYLANQPELFAFIESEPQIETWLSNPLLLSLFAFTYVKFSPDERKQFAALATQNDFRDKVFADYIQQRYAHEENKYHVKGLKPPFTHQELILALGSAATHALSGYRIFHSSDDDDALITQRFTQSDFDDVLEQTKIGLFIQFAKSLQLIIETDEYTYKRYSLLMELEQEYSFAHLLLRDYFAFTYAVNLLMKDPNAPGSWASTSALGKLGDQRALKALTHALNSQAQMVKISAIHSLAKIRHIKSLQIIQKAFKDKDPYIRSLVVDTLYSEFPDTIGQKVLINALDDPEESVQETAIYRVGKLKIVSLIPRLIEFFNNQASSYNLKDNVQRALYAMRSVSVPYLLEALNHSNPSVRSNSALTLASAEDIAFLNHFEKLLNDPESSVRYSGAYGLVHLGRVSFPIRLSILKDVNHKNWLHIAGCTTRRLYVEEEILPVMANALSAKSEEVVATALQFFQRVIYPEIKDKVLQLINNESRWIQSEAIEVLQHYRDRDIEDILLQKLAQPITYVTEWVDFVRKLDDVDLRKDIIKVLAQWKLKRAAKQIIENLYTEYDSLTYTSIEALGAIGSKKAIKPLTELLEATSDENRQSQIVEALEQIRSAR